MTRQLLIAHCEGLQSARTTFKDVCIFDCILETRNKDSLNIYSYFIQLHGNEHIFKHDTNYSVLESDLSSTDERASAFWSQSLIYMKLSLRPIKKVFIPEIGSFSYPYVNL